jgi:hypothetical protein
VSTPDFVKFSRVPGTIADALARFEAGTFLRFGLKYVSFAELQPDDDPWTGGFSLAGDSVPSGSRAEVLSMAAQKPAWGIAFGNAYLEFFETESDSFAVAMSFESAMMSVEYGEFTEGQWLRKLFMATVDAFRCEVCGYGADDAYGGGYEWLSPTVIVERLRAGELFMMGYPNFHAISVDLVSPDAMNALWDSLPRSKYLKRELTASGYHILSIMP